MILSNLACIVFIVYTVYSQQIDQSTLDNIATNLQVHFQVKDNLAGGTDTFDVELTLTNTGQIPIEKGPWAIYLCTIYMIEPKHLPAEKEFVIGNTGFKVSHVNGCQFKLMPTSQLASIASGGKVVLTYKIKYWSAARSDNMPNWYVASDGLQPRLLVSTSDADGLSHVGPYNSKHQWKRHEFDVYDPFTAEKRFEMNDINDLKSSGKPVIPTPVSANLDNANMLKVTNDWVVVADDAFKNEVTFLTEKLNIKNDPTSKGSRVIKLTLDDVDVNGMKSNESYILNINKTTEMVKIAAKHPSGAFYGIKTLLALLDKDRRLPAGEIKDAPRYGYRGMHLDVSRNFHAKKEILKLLDAMSMYKLNKFHMHLADDEGWRLEIPGLEELTMIGAKRCHDPDETKCTMPQLGSGPSDVYPGSGFYTVEDYKEILKYANQRHIQVIPSFDMPGHAHAAIKAMEARYKKFNQTNMAEAQKYLLTDIEDPSQYLSVQMFTDNSINPCIESTYNFIQHVISKVNQMHENIQPLKLYHFGGDEVAHGSWVNSTKCVSKFNATNSTEEATEQLKEVFAERIGNITGEMNIALGGWEDGLLGFKDVPYERSSIYNDVIAYAWQNIWEWGVANRAYKLANAGYKVVMSQATHLYFDHPYEPDPEETGYYWAPRFTDTRKVFGFMPDRLYDNVDVKRNGQPMTKDELCKDNACVSLEKPENIIGMQGQMWSETTRTPERLWRHIFPRILGLAERAWHKAAWEDVDDKTEREKQRKADWEKFANALGHKELQRLDDMDITYHIPVPGARFAGGSVKVKSAFPGLVIPYSEDNGKHWCDVTEDMDSPSGEKEKTIQLVTRSANGERTSRMTTLKIPRKVVSAGVSTHSLQHYVGALVAMVATLMHL